MVMNRHFEIKSYENKMKSLEVPNDSMHNILLLFCINADDQRNPL